MSENISASVVKELREKTGAGVMDCKTALKDSNGDIDKAIEVLRKKGIAAAAKKESRIATEGLIHAYIHTGGRIGAMVEINIETDFAAKNDMFKKLANDIAMQIAAVSPKYVTRNDVPEDVIQKEKEILMAQALMEGKPANIAEKITEGRMDKFFKEICLLEQPYIKDPNKTVEQLIKEVVAVVGENIVVRRFIRFERGEGIEKKVQNFAEEVMQQIGNAGGK